MAPCGMVYSIAMEDEIHVARNPEVPTGKRGLATFVSTHMVNKISRTFESSCDNALIILLEGMGPWAVGLINMYAPHSAAKKPVYGNISGSN